MVNFSQFSHPYLECTYDQMFQSTGAHPSGVVQATPLWRRNSWLPAQPKLQQSRTSVYAINQCTCHDPVYMPWSSVYAMNQCTCHEPVCMPNRFSRWPTRLNSVQLSCSVVSDSLQPHGLQHARPPCLSPAPGVYSCSCPLSRWCHPTISSCRPLLLPPSIGNFLGWN